MLTGMDKDMRNIFRPQFFTDRGYLHKIRPCADNTYDFHIRAMLRLLSYIQLTEKFFKKTLRQERRA
jgi:hypothetical protein